MSEPASAESVEDYLAELFVGADDDLDAALKSSSDAGLPPIAVSATQGKLLHLLARTLGARRILEVGTLGGYSGLWLARALPADGKLITCEIDPRHADVARTTFDRAGFDNLIEVRRGPAAATLQDLVDTAVDPFDLVFIDADKSNNPTYVRLALQLTRPGSLIIVDNVIRGGRVIDESSTSPDVIGTREVLALMASDPRLDATAVQTVGSKHWDGFALAYVN